MVVDFVVGFVVDFVVDSDVLLIDGLEVDEDETELVISTELPKERNYFGNRI